MNPQEYLQKLQNRFRDYAHLKVLVTSSMTREEFEQVRNDVIDYIGNDTAEYLSFSRSGSVPVISKTYGELSRVSTELVEYLSCVRNLMGF